MAKLDLTVKAAVEGTRQLKSLENDLGDVDKKAKTLGGSFKQAGAGIAGMINPTALAVGGVTALAGGLALAAKAALDEEAGIAQLTAALKANDPAGAANIDQIEETIRAREKLAFADDEQRESLARLVSVTKDTTKALKLQRTAMDLARLRGIDLATASDIVGKVYSGNIGILGRYGIKLEEGATAAEALAEIQSRSAGQAEEYANTTAGSIESLGMVFDDLVEDIGAKLLPILKDLAVFARDQLIPALEGVGDAAGWFGELIERINPTGAAINNLADDIREYQARQKKNLKEAGEDWESYQNYVSMSVDGVSEAAAEIAQIPITEIEARWDDVRAAAFESQVQHELGILDGQNRIKVAMEALTRIQSEEQSKSQRIAYLTGQLTVLAQTDGMRVNKPKAQAMAATITSEIQAELTRLTGIAYNSGLSIPGSISAGMYANSHLVDGASSYLASKISGYLPRSDAKVGPLSDLTKVGPALVGTIAQGITHSLGAASSAAGALAGVMSPMIPAGGAAAAPAVAGGGVSYNLNVSGQVGQLDEKTLMRMLDRMVFTSGFGERLLLGRG